MNIPNDLHYAESHEWVRMTGEKTARIGISDFAQAELGDIVFVNLPEVGDTVQIGESFADVESVKAVSDIYSPLTGVVSAVNEAVLDAPESINSAPYEAWFIEVSEISEQADLLDAKTYEEHCSKEE